MRITSTAFRNNENIPFKYTCDGENINPPLEISGTPENAKSLVLIVDDPDAPRGTWSHWLVWNIDPATEEIPTHSIPAGATEGKTDFGDSGYFGPCPPGETHRYFFKIYALDITLNIPSNSNKTSMKKAMEGHILASGNLIGSYSR